MDPHEDLPDLPDAELLAEAQTLLATCRPLHRTPSSARMRRVLRATVRLLEEKQQNKLREDDGRDRPKRQRDTED